MANTTNGQVNHAVRYDKFGGIDELYIAELPVNEVTAEQVLVKVKAAGINPGEASIRSGALKEMFPSTFPSGQGTDFAGVVTAVGDGVKDFKIGDQVIGFSNDRNSHAEYVAVKHDQLTKKPENVTWEQAGGLFVAGTTAYAGVKALNLSAGDVVIISGAAGGVGSLAVQLAKNQGAEVLGFAGKGNHEWLKKHGIKPVAYGDDNLKAIEDALNGCKPSALFDASGKGYVQLGIDLGIPKEKINTIIDFEAAKKYGVKTDGSAAASTATVLKELAEWISEGKLELPVADTYPLADVKSAFEELEKRHTHGKIVLIP